MDPTLIQLIQHIYNLEVEKLRLTAELNELKKKEDGPRIPLEERKPYEYVR